MACGKDDECCSTLGFALPASVATMALMLSILSSFVCFAIEFGPVDEENDLNSDLPTLNFGVWNYKSWELGENFDGEPTILKGCSGYPSSVDLDAKWKTAQAFSIISVVFGFLLMFTSWAYPCIGHKFGFQKLSVLGYSFVGLAQGLTLLFLDSAACNDNDLIEEISQVLVYQDECERDWGSNTNIASVLLWFCAAVGAMYVVKLEERGVINYNDEKEKQSGKEMVNKVDEQEDSEDEDRETE